MLRLEPEHAQSLADAAHAARLPVAVFARELILNRTPKVAPPLVADLTFEAQKLLRVCYGAASNMTQLNAAAQASGEPLSRLSGPSGLIFKLHSRVREIGLQIKSGGQLDSTKTGGILARLEAPARRLNDELARPLNEGSAPSMEAWKSVLDDLQNALLESAE